MQRIVISLALFLLINITGFLVTPQPILAGYGDLVCAGEWIQHQPCAIDRDTGDRTCSYSCSTGTGGGTCAAGTYRCNTGCCPVGVGCKCGEFYACPTVNNPSSTSLYLI